MNAAPLPVSRHAKRSVTAALIMLMLINAVNYADRGVLSLIQEPLKHELGLTDFQIGLLIGPSFALFYAVMGIPVARLAERFNRAKIIIVAVTLWSLFTGACGLAQGFVQLALWRMGVGATESGAPPASHALIADYYPREKRGRAMAIMTIGLPVGSFYGGITGGLIAGAFGWRWAFVAAAIPGLILAVLCSIYLFEPRRQGSVSAPAAVIAKGASALSLLRSPAIRMLMVIALLSGFVGNAIPNFVAAFFIRAHGLSLAQAGQLTAAGLGICGMFGAWTSGYLADRFDRGRGISYYQVPAFACLASLILSITCFWLGNTPASIVVYLMSAFTGIMIISPTFAAVQNVIDPRNRATAAAMYLFCITTAGALGPATVGLLSDILGGAQLGLDRTAYALACPGGRAVSAAVTQAACHDASALGLRFALMLVCLVYLVLVPVYLFAARIAEPELAARKSVGPESQGETFV